MKIILEMCSLFPIIANFHRYLNICSSFEDDIRMKHFISDEGEEVNLEVANSNMGEMEARQKPVPHFGGFI